MSIMFGSLSDRLLSRGHLKVSTAAKMFECIGLGIPAISVGLMGFFTQVTNSSHSFTNLEFRFFLTNIYNDRECVRAGAAGARTRRSLGHQLLHPLILRLLVLCAPADFETQSSPGCTCTRRSKFLTHSVNDFWQTEKKSLLWTNMKFVYFFNWEKLVEKIVKRIGENIGWIR